MAGIHAESATGPRIRGPLVGRARELALVRRQFRRAASGTGQIVLVEGEAGVGKTRLAEEFMAEAAATGAAALWGEGRVIDRERPFGALLDALDKGVGADRVRELLGEIGDAHRMRVTPFSVANQWEAAGARSIAADRIVAAIQAQASLRPSVLLLEDVEWIDDASLLALHRLIPRLNSGRLLLLMTSRHSLEPRIKRTVHADVNASGGLTIELGPLSPDAVHAFATTVLGGQPDAELRDYLARAGGNPLFLTELVATLKAGGAVAGSDGLVRAKSVVPPSSLRSLILGRLAYLPDSGWAILRVASVVGTDFAPALLSAVTGHSAFDIMAALHDAVRTGLIVDAGDVLSFRHALVRDAIYYDIPTALRSQLHADIAKALRLAGAPANLVGAHLAQGAGEGDPDAISSLRRAAAQPVTSPNAAAAYLAKALEIAGGESPERSEIAAEHTIALIAAGRLAEAETAARTELRRRIAGDGARQLRLALSQALLLQGRLRESIAELEEVAAESQGDPSAVLEILAETSYRRVLAGDLDVGVGEAEMVLTRSEDAKAELPAAIARLAISHALFYRGYFHEAVELSRAALQTARRLGSADVASMIDADLGVFLIHADQGVEAASVLRPRDEAWTGASAWQLPRHHYAAGYQFFYSGGWDEATREFEDGLRLASELHVDWWAAAVRSSLASIYIHRDQLRAAESILDAMPPIDPSSPDLSADYVLATQALLAEAQGRHADAVQLIEQAADLVESWGLLSRYRRIAIDVVRLCRSGSARPKSTVEALETVATRADVGSIRGLALLCRGTLEGDQRTLQDAIMALMPANRPLELATAYEEAGALAAASGEPRKSAQLFGQATRIYAAIGARRDRSRASLRARTLGVRLGSKAPHRPTSQGWGSITAAEDEVIRLVVEGLGNREIAHRLFLSRRTVEAHLSTIYAKLSVEGRLRLAVEAADRGFSHLHG